MSAEFATSATWSLTCLTREPGLLRLARKVAGEADIAEMDVIINNIASSSSDDGRGWMCAPALLPGAQKRRRRGTSAPVRVAALARCARWAARAARTNINGGRALRKLADVPPAAFWRPCSWCTCAESRATRRPPSPEAPRGPRVVATAGRRAPHHLSIRARWRLSPSGAMPDYSRFDHIIERRRGGLKQRRPRRRARRRTCSRIWRTTSVGSTSARQMPPWRRPRTTTATRACRTSVTRTSPNWTPPPTWRATASQTAQFASPNSRPARTTVRLPCAARHAFHPACAQRAGCRARCSAGCAASTCGASSARSGALVAPPSPRQLGRTRDGGVILRYEPTPPRTCRGPTTFRPTSAMSPATWRLNTRTHGVARVGACRG